MESVRVTTLLFFWFRLSHTELIRHKTFYSILPTTVTNIFHTSIIVQRFTIGKGARP